MTLQGVSRAGMALVCIGLLGLVVVSMMVTNPTSLGPTGVTLWFVGLGVVLAICFAFAKYLAVMHWGREASKANRRRVIIASVRHGVLISVGLTTLLALSSLQQLDIRDVGLVTVLLVLVEFFARTRTRIA